MLFSYRVNQDLNRIVQIITQFTSVAFEKGQNTIQGCQKKIACTTFLWGSRFYFRDRIVTCTKAYDVIHVVRNVICLSTFQLIVCLIV